MSTWSIPRFTLPYSRLSGWSMFEIREKLDENGIYR